MQTSGGPHSAAGPLGAGLIVVAGLFIAVISVFLLVNPGGLPTYFYIGYFARFVPVLFLGVVALVWPLLPLLLALVVMFGGEALTDLARPLFPISPFWMLLALTMGAQIARNIHRNRAVPWGEATMLMFLALWAALYDLEEPNWSAQGLLLPLLAGISLVVALGSLRTWRQIAFVLVAMYLAFILLEGQLLPFLAPSWGATSSVLRDQFGGLSPSLRQATTLDWLFNMMALLSVGMAVRQRGRWRVVLMGFFLAFGASSILTFSRGAFLGLGAGMLALLLLERRGSRRSFLWIVVAGALVAAVAYYSGSWANNAGQRGLGMEISNFQAGVPGRLSLWVDAVKAMPRHVLIGTGSSLLGVGAHSSLVDMWNNYGGIYAIAFWVFIFVLFRRSYRMAKAPPEATSSTGGRAIALGLYCSFAGAIANAMFDPTFLSLVFAGVFWMMRGLELGIWKSQLIAVPGSGRRTHYGITHHEALGTQTPGHTVAGPGQPFS